MTAAVRTGAPTRSTHVDSRLPQILDAAARLFCTQGYQGTTVRDIARSVGMLPGSLYCHFATKDDLLAAVHVRGVDRICAAVEAGVARCTEPWARLEAACVAHLEAILRDDDYARVVVRVRPSDAPAVADRLIAQREHRLGLGDVGRDTQHRAVVGVGQLVGLGPHRVGVDVGDHHVGAGLSQCARVVSAQQAAGAGDDRDAARE